MAGWLNALMVWGREGGEYDPYSSLDRLERNGGRVSVLGYGIFGGLVAEWLCMLCVVMSARLRLRSAGYYTCVKRDLLVFG